MSESFTFRGSEDVQKGQKIQKIQKGQKGQTIQKDQTQKQQKLMSSLHYSVQRFDMDTIQKMNRLQLFEILYQVEQSNCVLKKQNGFEKTTTFYLQQMHERAKEKSILKPESQSDHIRDEDRESDRQYKKLIKLINSQKHTKKQQQADKIYQQTVSNLQSQISQYQNNLQNTQPTVTQLEQYLNKLQSQIKQSQQRLAKKQVMQKYLKHKNIPIQNSQHQDQSIDDSQSDGEIDLMMEEFYTKVKNVMVINCDSKK